MTVNDKFQGCERKWLSPNLRHYPRIYLKRLRTGKLFEENYRASNEMVHDYGKYVGKE
jgi:hypothetical protein